jgi:hypothetical protein
MRRRARARCWAAALAVALLAGCGHAPPGKPVHETVYLLDPQALGDLLATKRPEALAFLPEDGRAHARTLPPEKLRALANVLAKSWVVRLVQRDDATFALTIREQASSGVWALTEAKGTWVRKDDTLLLSIRSQEGNAELASPVVVKVTPTGVLVPARGRLLPLRQYPL